MTDPAIAAKIDDTHDAVVLVCDDKLLTVLAQVAFPPGRPMQVSLALPDGPLVLVARCIGSKKRDDGSFTVRMRLTNLRREMREAILRTFSPATTTPSS
jgi:hypothetical protein